MEKLKMRLANTPSNMTLRPNRESSADVDNKVINSPKFEEYMEGLNKTNK